MSKNYKMTFGRKVLDTLREINLDIKAVMNKEHVSKSEMLEELLVLKDLTDSCLAVCDNPNETRRTKTVLRRIADRRERVKNNPNLI